MKKSIKISLKPGEKIYVNGAVIRVDRKTSLEFLNDVQFLLENHVMQPEQATTPLKQLYFIVQVMMMSPHDCEQAKALFQRSIPVLLHTIKVPEILAGLKHIDALVAQGDVYEALKQIRTLYRFEEPVVTETDETPALRAVAGE
ncbi:flagellar biosynthesis repressor FlbT [Limoniibacter endophyticus]|uniref:Probable flagellum biosynthesis repressor protein FlbT n=1 Tax=Limoniibacter endophyticus TaxID=1565040 RepID=A0A8J3GH56_9HYPH|nr:flagellar biosynthesis repressor FlbT [Limoniibacter endophyticus]GHC64471.1 putative flagellum biosynthesis repressor protein FlbT [Limoniibacter endophyticus]